MKQISWRMGAVIRPARPIVAAGLAALAVLSACSDQDALGTMARRCDAKLAAVIDPNVYDGIAEAGAHGMALVTAARLETDPERRAAIGDGVRLIVSKVGECDAYDTEGRPLGNFSTALSTDRLSWWVRSDGPDELGLTNMVQQDDRTGAPATTFRFFRMTAKPNDPVINTRYYPTKGEPYTEVYAKYEYTSETNDLTLTTASAINHFAGDGRLLSFIRCFRFDDPHCADEKYWETFTFQYDDGGRVIAQRIETEGLDHTGRLEIELNERGDIIRSRYLDDTFGSTEWEERKILLPRLN